MATTQIRVNAWTPYPKTSRISLMAFGLGMCIWMAPRLSYADVLDIKTGSWEMTQTTAIEGMMMPKEVLEKMPPAQRAKVEQSMRARAAKPVTTTFHSCVTKEDIDHGAVYKSENSNCTRRVLSHTARKLEVEETCPPPRATQSHFTLEAKSNQSYVGAMEMTRSEGGKVHMDLNARWVGAACKKGVDD
jgi:hypothetical protein